MPASTTDTIGASIKNSALECFNSYDAKLEQNLSKPEYEALKSLINDNNIIIQKSDKGNSVVIMNKADYVNRMNELLSDVTKFKKLNIEPGQDYNFIINQELRISKALRDIKNNGAMMESLYQQLNPTGTQPSVLYGLGKIHKPAVNNIPKLRPILSAINSPTYKLSQYINKLLKPFTMNQYTTKDSFNFALDISKQDSSHHMSSLDVDSLFTNIPLNETIQICGNLLFRDNPIVDGLNKEQFEQLLTIATTESLILFDGIYYQQTDGVAMGSPLGPTLANVFLCHHEQQWLATCPKHIKPVYYQRYVDDIFILHQNSNCLTEFQQYLNQQHPNMHFTSEEENDDTLPFLDIFVTRKNSTFYTSVYRKPTFSGVYTHFTSYLPVVYKESLVSTLLYRAHRICTNWNEIHKETMKVRTLMLRNGYPDTLLDKLIAAFFNRICSSKPTNTKETDSLLLVLPYLGKYTKQLQKKIKQTLSDNLPNIQVRIVNRASTRLSSLFRFKDRIPKYLSSGIVYKYTCSGCSSTYIGETVRHAKRRFEEHMGKSALTGKPLACPPPTAISEHTKTCGATPTTDDFVIIGREGCEQLLRVKESLFIHRDRPVLNIQGQSIKLNLFK